MAWLFVFASAFCHFSQILFFEGLLFGFLFHSTFTMARLFCFSNRLSKIFDIFFGVSNGGRMQHDAARAASRTVIKIFTTRKS
jgi:uncharacterized membrane protein AbrB (regulator of aidB expression)